MSEQENQTTMHQRPTTDDRAEWKAFWAAQGMPWRTEPEIDEERQQYLTERRNVQGDIARNICPFRDRNTSIKLTRADVEWLLATHEDGRGPVIWDDVSQSEREGVDLGGADLSGTQLEGLPLTASLLYYALIEDANLSNAHLERAELFKARLAGARLEKVHAEYARLTEAHLERASVSEGNFDHASLIGTHLEGTELREIRLSDAELYAAHLEGANMVKAHLERANLIEAHLEDARLDRAHLEGANLSTAHFEAARLLEAHLESIFADEVHLEGAWLFGAHLEGAYLAKAHLEGKRVSTEDVEQVRPWAMPHFHRFVEVLPPADMRQAYLDSATNLKGVTFGNHEFGFVQVVDVHWGGTNLSVVDWSQGKQPYRPWWLKLALRIRIPIRESFIASALVYRGHGVTVGEERIAKESRKGDGNEKENETRLSDYQAAVRANRQLATSLRDQGLNEDADRFAYSARLLQRQVLGRQRRYLSALGSSILDLIAGYGYKPMRSVAAYIVIILAFAGAYLLNAQFAAPHLTWDEALVLSISAFHGRGFFTTGISLGDTLARLAAGEAIIGLLIEITFIATFTQRFFAR